MLNFFWYFRYIFIFFTEYFLKKTYFVRCSNTLSQHLPLLYFLGYFLTQNSFCFLCSSYQKKVRAVRSFPPQNQSKLPNQTGRTTVGGSCGGDGSGGVGGDGRVLVVT